MGLLLCAVATSCGSKPGQHPAAMGLPAWVGEDRQAFTDDIDPEAVGLTLDPRDPRRDGFLRQRAQVADVVARVKVMTVTVDRVGQAVTYHIGIRVGDPPLATPRLEQREFELHISPETPAYGIAKAFDTRLQGMTFIGFIKRFVGEDGEPTIHWHLSADSAEVAAAVQEAVVLQEVSGS